MRTRLITLFILLIGLSSCDKCDDKTKYFNAELFPAVRETFYDWKKVQELSGDTIYLGVGTKYLICAASGQEELKAGSNEFYIDREIVLGIDTISPKTNLLTESSIVSYIAFNKETDAFFNSPQYLIQIDNKTLKLKDYYTFYFKGFTVSGVEISDSTIAYIK